MGLEAAIGLAEHPVVRYEQFLPGLLAPRMERSSIMGEHSSLSPTVLRVCQPCATPTAGVGRRPVASRTKRPPSRGGRARVSVAEREEQHRLAAVEHADLAGHTPCTYRADHRADVPTSVASDTEPPSLPSSGGETTAGTLGGTPCERAPAHDRLDAVTADPPFDDTVLRHAFGTFPSGVTAVCALRDGAPTGMAASSFTAVSLRPPLVSVCIARTSNTWTSLRESPRLGVSILADDQDHIAVSLAARDIYRFADLRVTHGDDGALLIDNSCLWLECSVYDQVPAGDHDIVLLEIHGLTAFDREPLVFHGSAYRQLVFPGQ